VRNADAAARVSGTLEKPPFAPKGPVLEAISRQANAHSGSVFSGRSQ